MKNFEEVYEFSLSVDGNGLEDHMLCTATKAELKTFVQQVMSLENNSRIVEIGTYTGRSASVYLQLQQERNFEIHLIDKIMWNPAHATHHFWKMVVQHFIDTSFTFHKMESNRAAEGWDLPIDFLYLDGQHEPPEVNDDFRNWTPFVKSGGILATHDSQYWGVKPCIDRYVSGQGWKLLSEAERMLIWRKP